MAKQSHLGRTLEHFRKLGYIAERVEHWNHHARKRQDLLGVFDVLVIDEMFGRLIGVQVTDDSHLAEHITKICNSENAKSWARGNGQIQVVTWRKEKGRWNHRVFLLNFNGTMWFQMELSSTTSKYASSADATTAAKEKTTTPLSQSVSASETEQRHRRGAGHASSKR